MVEFLLEVYEGDEWVPADIWGTPKTYHEALDKLQHMCECHGHIQDAHRLKVLKTTDSQITAHTKLEEHKREHGNK